MASWDNIVFILSVPVPAFLSANQLPEYLTLVLIIGLIAAVTAGLRSKLLRLPFLYYFGYWCTCSLFS